MKIEPRVGLGTTCACIDTCHSIVLLHSNLYVHYALFFRQRPEKRLAQTLTLLLSSS